MNASVVLAQPKFKFDDVVNELELELEDIQIPEGLRGHDIAEACLDVSRALAKGRGWNVSDDTLAILAERLAMSKSEEYRRYRAWSFAAAVVEDGVAIDFSTPTAYYDVVQRVSELDEYIQAAKNYEQEGYANEQDELDTLNGVLETIRNWSRHDEEELTGTVMGITALADRLKSSSVPALVGKDQRGKYTVTPVIDWQMTARHLFCAGVGRADTYANYLCFWHGYRMLVYVLDN